MIIASVALFKRFLWWNAYDAKTHGTNFDWALCLSKPCVKYIPKLVCYSFLFYLAWYASERSFPDVFVNVDEYSNFHLCFDGIVYATLSIIRVLKFIGTCFLAFEEIWNTNMGINNKDFAKYLPMLMMFSDSIWEKKVIFSTYLIWVSQKKLERK